MTLPRTVADVLSHHVSFEIEAIDRMYCNVYQPKLQYTAGAAGFFVGHRGFTYASSALMAQMTEAFVAIDDPAAVPALCDTLDAHPFTAADRAGLRFGDARAQALLSTLFTFRLHPE